MEVLVIPGINGLGKTKGVEGAYKEFFQKPEILNLNVNDVSEQIAQIKEKTKKYFNENKILFFGGDHSISFPLVSNFFKKYEKESKLLVFDAHPDTMEPMQEPGHEEWLRALIEKGFPIENILIVGIRKNSKNVTKSEIDYLKEKGIDFIYSYEFEENKQKIINFVKGGPLYVSFDVDVFDSSIISCTGYAEKEGLNEEQVFSILEKIMEVKNNLYFDLVEINFKKGSEKDKEKTIKGVRKLLKTVGVE